MTNRFEPSEQLDLISKCLEGDRKAQEQIYKLYYKAMFNTSMRLLQNYADAEDAMQEAFLSAFLKLKSYRFEVSFGSWLKRIVINKSIDILRARKIKFEEPEEYIDKVFVNNEDFICEAESETETMKTIEKIKQAMTEMPYGYRVSLSLSLFEGYDHDEIAQILGISSATSRSQLSRAKRRLLDFLKNHGS